MPLRIAFMATTLVLAQTPIDSEAKLFIDGLQRINSQDKTVSADFDAKGPLFTKAMTLDPNVVPPITRLSAANWLLQRNKMMGISYSGKTSYLQAARGQKDLLQAWRLLEPSVTADDERQQTELQLEIAWRLVDPEKMMPAYNQVSSRSKLDPRELTHCFMVSAQLGKWDAFKGFAEELKKRGANLQGFHNASLNNLSTLDYESLLQAVESGKPGSEITPMVVQSFRIKNWRCHVNSVSGSNQALVGPITEQMKNAPKDWFAHAESKVLLVQVGASAHWLESAAQPPVSGFIERDRMFLTGYRDTKDQTGKPARQIDLWEMKADPTRPGYWRGTNKLVVPSSDIFVDSNPALQVVMDHEWEMVPQEKFTASSTQPSSK